MSAWGMVKSIALCLALYPFKDCKLDNPSQEISAKPAVLCVHGFLHNETPWKFYRRELQKRGVGPVHNLCYHSIKWNIPHNSLMVKARIEEVKEQTGKDVQILIGHSLGGLVCLEYALEHAPKDRITYVITLGSPLHGTTMTKLGFGPSVAQMRIGSSYLQSLHERLAQAKHLRVLALAADQDIIVKPRSSAGLPEYSYATSETINNMGHVEPLFSPAAVERIALFLKQEGLVI